MNGRSRINNSNVIVSDDEYRKLTHMFPEYFFLSNDYSICMAGRNIEESLNYKYGSLRGKNINVLSDEDDLKSSLMIQISEDFFEWRRYTLKSNVSTKVEVELCGFRISSSKSRISPIAIRVRYSRNHLENTASPEVAKLTYWIAHNLRGPLATLEGLINLAKIQKNDTEVATYLDHMSDHAQRMDDKIRLMIRMTEL
jgi:nitrogen-specific signal transduction histidine kinase